MRLILIRHGETDANLLMRWSGSKDLEITNLTTAGKSQAQELGSWFKKESFIPTHVYVSPQKRAQDTARLAGGHWNIPFVILALYGWCRYYNSYGCKSGFFYGF